MKFNKPSIIYSSIAVISLSLMGSGWVMGFSGDKQYVAKDTVDIVQVEVGEFSQKVNGYGALESLHQRLITASSTGTIDEILLKPGAEVSAETVLMTLSNPALEANVKDVMADLHNKKTTKRKMYLEQQRELLLQESNLAQLIASAELANLKVEAQAPLIKVGIISGMEGKRIELEAKQLNERVALEQQRFEKLQEVHKEQLLIQDDAIAQAQSKFEDAKSQLERLVVKAGIDGVLQQLPVSLGQSVNTGDQLALVGNMDALIAQVKVPQLQANLIQVGQEAEIDTRHGLVSGQVIRIDPVVNQGAVSVEIQLPPNLSSNIRPMQVIDAVIYGESRLGVASVKMPSGLTHSGKQSVFKLINDVEAVKVDVQFGQAASDVVEVVSGLKPGDKIIAQVHSLNADVEKIQLVSKTM